MSRIPTVDPKQATGKAKVLLDTVQQSLGRVPNLVRVLANAPAALDSYLQFSSALAGGSLDAKVREQIALAVAEANLCNYCLAAHSAIGGMVGLAKGDVEAARHATAPARKTDALLKLARSIVVNRGEIPDADLQAARDAGIGDGEVVEVVANVAFNILTNYTNHVAQTVVDFPKVAPAGAVGGGR